MSVPALFAQRNYHIFYQMLTASAAERAPRKLGSPNDFSLLTTSGCTTAEGIDDSKEFKEMMAALTNLGFSDDEQKQLLNAESFKELEELERSDSIYPDAGPVSQAADL